MSANGTYNPQVDDEIVLDPTLGESVPSTDGQAGKTGGDQSFGQKVGLTHPIAVAFQLFFKIFALIVFLVFPLFASFVTIFILVIVLLAMDFWTVKNVTGRLLVGLRWWNQIKPDGSNEWIFESYENKRQIHKTEMVIFWGSTLLAPVVWVILALAEFVTFQWASLLISLVALSFAMSNAAGYIKCARQARQQVTEMITGYVTQKAVEHITQQISNGVSQQLNANDGAASSSTTSRSQ